MIFCRRRRHSDAAASTAPARRAASPSRCRRRYYVAAAMPPPMLPIADKMLFRAPCCLRDTRLRHYADTPARRHDSAACRRCRCHCAAADIYDAMMRARCQRYAAICCAAPRQYCLMRRLMFLPLCLLRRYSLPLMLPPLRCRHAAPLMPLLDTPDTFTPLRVRHVFTPYATIATRYMARDALICNACLLLRHARCRALMRKAALCAAVERAQRMMLLSAIRALLMPALRYFACASCLLDCCRYATLMLPPLMLLMITLMLCRHITRRFAAATPRYSALLMMPDYLLPCRQR